MLLAKVVGTVVATRKDPKVEGFKFLLLRQVNPETMAEGGFVVANDAVGCGVGEFVLYATGWANRYGFPAEPVAERWRAAGALGLDTAVAGTVSLRFLADGRILPPRGYRLENNRFWWHDSGLAQPAHAVSSGD